MANKLLQQFLFNPNRMQTAIDARIVLGASGSVASFSGNGISNVVRNAAGQYTITLQQPSNAFLSMSASMNAAVAGTGSGIDSVETTGVPNTRVQSSLLDIQTLNPAGVVADGVSGSTISIQLMLRNSSVAF